MNKNWYQSKTIWFAVLQAISGIILAIYTDYPAAGYLLMLKSTIDFFLRLSTEKPIA